MSAACSRRTARSLRPERPRAQTEALIDAAAEGPWTVLETDLAARLAGLLEPLARTVADPGLLPPGNPVGLPHGSCAVGR